MYFHYLKVLILVSNFWIIQQRYDNYLIPTRFSSIFPAFLMKLVKDRNGFVLMKAFVLEAFSTYTYIYK